MIGYHFIPGDERLLAPISERERADIELRHRAKLAGWKAGRGRIYSARVAAIRADRDAGMNRHDVALKHGISEKRVSAICPVSHHNMWRFR